MKAIAITVVIVVLGLGSQCQFDPQIRVLGNVVQSIGEHLFARFRDTEVPAGSRNGTFIEQVNYIHQMLKKTRDYYMTPPQHLKNLLRDLTQSFILQVQSQLSNLDIEDKVLKENFGLSDVDITRFHELAKESKEFVTQIIGTRDEATEKVSEKYPNYEYMF